MSESKADEVVTALRVAAALTSANDWGVGLGNETEDCGDFNICTPINVLQGQHDFLPDLIRMLTVILSLLGDKSPDNLFDYCRFSNFDLICGTVLSAPCQVDLIEIERPEGRFKVN